MASRIQGITVEIGGDTTKLSKALESVNKSIKGTQSGLKDVNKLLKLDPSNTELVVQKQKIMNLAAASGEDLATTSDIVTDALTAFGLSAADSGHFVDTFGGEFEWDRYTVKFHKTRGADHNVHIIYGKNLTDFKMEKSIENTITGVHPYWVDNETQAVMELPEKVVLQSKELEERPNTRQSVREALKNRKKAQEQQSNQEQAKPKKAKKKGEMEL